MAVSLLKKPRTDFDGVDDRRYVFPYALSRPGIMDPCQWSYGHLRLCKNKDWLNRLLYGHDQYALCWKSRLLEQRDARSPIGIVDGDALLALESYMNHYKPVIPRLHLSPVGRERIHGWSDCQVPRPMQIRMGMRHWLRFIKLMKRQCVRSLYSSDPKTKIVGETKGCASGTRWFVPVCGNIDWNRGCARRINDLDEGHWLHAMPAEKSARKAGTGRCCSFPQTLTGSEKEHFTVIRSGSHVLADGVKAVYMPRLNQTKRLRVAKIDD